MERELDVRPFKGSVRERVPLCSRTEQVEKTAGELVGIKIDDDD